MKKSIVIMLIATACVFGFGSLVFAQEMVTPEIGEEDKVTPALDEEDKIAPATEQLEEGYEMLRGRIMSVNKKKNQVIISIDSTGQERLITSENKLPSNIKIGLHVKAKVKEGTNQADYVKKIHHAGE